MAREIGINRLVVTLVTMRKLSLTNQLDGIIPLLGSLQTEFSGVIESYHRSFSGYEPYHPSSLITQAHLHLTIPFHLLLVIVIGKQRHSSEHRIITLHHPYTSCVRNIVLEELEIMRSPPMVQKLGRVMTISISAASTSIAFGVSLLLDDIRMILRVCSAQPAVLPPP